MIEHLAWLLLAAFLIGLSKGGLAAAGALAVPMLALFISPVQAAALLLPVLILTDAIAIWLYRREFSTRNVTILIPAVLVGILLGALMVPFVSEPILLALTGAIGLWTVWRRWFGVPSAASGEARIGHGAFWGTIAGVTTFITHSGAPPMQAYLLPQNLPRLIFAGTMAITFGITNLAKIPSYYSLGLLDDLNWPLILMMGGVGLIGTVAGRWIIKAMSDAIYSRVIEVLLLLLSIILLTKAASAYI